jgi:protein-tyrosine sulfotransferase
MQSAFVLCLPRSGSTLLSWLLDTHPDVCCPPELFLAKAVDALELVLRQTTGAHLTGDAQRAFVAGEIRRILAAPIEAYASARGKRIWVEKTPLHTIESIRQMRTTFPDARLLFLYRNCLDLARSCLDFSAHGFKLQGLAQYVVASPDNLMEALARYWCDGTDRMLGIEERNAERSFRVRYEDLAKDPRAVAPAIFAHLGVDCPPDLVDRVFATDHGVGLGDINILFKRGFEDETGKGQLLPYSMLHQRTRARVDALSAKLGYPPLDGDPAVPFPDDLVALFEKELPDRLRASRPTEAGVTCKFAIRAGTTERSWVVDLMGDVPRIIAGDKPADCTASVSANVMREIASGRLNAARATEDGRMRLTGNKQIAFIVCKALFFPKR